MRMNFFFKENLKTSCFNKKNGQIIAQALKIMNERKKEYENNCIKRKETLVDKVEKTKEIYLIKMTTKMVNSEIGRLDKCIKDRNKTI